MISNPSSINLRIPGPTPLPKEVLEALSWQMVNHRGHVYEEIQARVVKNLKYFFQTKNDIFLLTSSGMGGLEATVSNFFSQRDTIVSFTCGEFGNRWAEIARRFGTNVVQVKFPPGEAVTKDKVRQILAEQKNISGVLFTHNETATGVLNKVEEFVPFVKNHKSTPLFLVDAISSLGAIDLPMDELGIDVLISASQKAWMAPPGLAMIAVSPYAWKKHKVAKMPRYYFDLSMYKEFAAKNQTPATPAVSVLYGLDVSLQLMKKEGRGKIYRRHQQIMQYLRKGIRKLDLELFVADCNASPTVTSIKIPEGVDSKKWLEILHEKYKVILAGGMGETKGKIIRVAHMGYVSKKDVDGVLSALRRSLKEMK